MSRETGSRWGATGLALLLACGVVAWMSVGSPVQAKCPYPLICVGDYATQDIVRSVTFDYRSILHCQRAEDIAYGDGQDYLLAAGQNQCGHTKNICGQQWVKDSCIEVPLPEGQWLYTVKGHFEFSCKICAPKPIPHEQDPES